MCLAYSGGLNDIPESSPGYVSDLDRWIVAARRHPILTQIRVDMDCQNLCDALPQGIEPGHDGMQVRTVVPSDCLPSVIFFPVQSRRILPRGAPCETSSAKRTRFSSRHRRPAPVQFFGIKRLNGSSKIASDVDGPSDNHARRCIVCSVTIRSRGMSCGWG